MLLHYIVNVYSLGDRCLQCYTLPVITFCLSLLNAIAGYFVLMLCSWQYRTCRCWWPQGILFPFPLSSRCGFLECRPLAGEYPAKRLCVVRPALGAYISGTRLVRGTYSLAGCSCTSYSPPSRGMGFHKLSIVYFLRLSICPCSIDIVSHHIMS